MFFRNDDLGQLTDAERAALKTAMHEYATADEVRFGADTRILAPILNMLIEQRAKFYLVHLPGGGGWVLRRHRPTGEFHGHAPKPVSQGGADTGPSPAQLQDPAGDRCTAEKYFGIADPESPRAGARGGREDQGPDRVRGPDAGGGAAEKPAR